VRLIVASSEQYFPVGLVLGFDILITGAEQGRNVLDVTELDVTERVSDLMVDMYGDFSMRPSCPEHDVYGDVTNRDALSGGGLWRIMRAHNSQGKPSKLVVTDIPLDGEAPQIAAHILKGVGTVTVRDPRLYVALFKPIELTFPVKPNNPFRVALKIAASHQNTRAQSEIPYASLTDI
jgi:hypothetical protein